MVEDYKIKQNIFIVVETGEYIVSRNGRRVKNRIGVEYYDTYKFGRLTHDKWIQLVLIEVDRDGKRDLLEWIKNHCSKHCVWLKTEADIEHYALRCLVSHAYEAWSDYKYAGLPCFNLRDLLCMIWDIQIITALDALKAEWVIGTISGEIFRKYLKADQNLNGWSVFPS